jgi:hypothetical protein
MLDPGGVTTIERDIVAYAALKPFAIIWSWWWAFLRFLDIVYRLSKRSQGTHACRDL